MQKKSEYFNKEAIALENAGDIIFDFPGLEFTLRTEQSKAILNAPVPKVIIAGAGMSQGGRIVHHEKNYLGDPKNTILFVGYQAMNSPGRRILDGAKMIKIHKQEINIHASIRAIGGYSAHADQPALLDWLSPMSKSLRKVFLVHGEEDQMEIFSRKVQDELAVSVEIPTQGQEVIL